MYQFVAYTTDEYYADGFLFPTVHVLNKIPNIWVY